uniref:Uncharacterized protein n=1 Tax=Arundo donax TaxID=35708 RepID=A0A0A9H7N7_ARUDO
MPIGTEGLPLFSSNSNKMVGELDS